MNADGVIGFTSTLEGKGHCQNTMECWLSRTWERKRNIETNQQIWLRTNNRCVLAICSHTCFVFQMALFYVLHVFLFKFIPEIPFLKIQLVSDGPTDGPTGGLTDGMCSYFHMWNSSTGRTFTENLPSEKLPGTRTDGQTDLRTVGRTRPLIQSHLITTAAYALNLMLYTLLVKVEHRKLAEWRTSSAGNTIPWTTNSAETSSTWGTRWKKKLNVLFFPNLFSSSVSFLFYCRYWSRMSKFIFGGWAF